MKNRLLEKVSGWVEEIASGPKGQDDAGLNATTSIIERPEDSLKGIFDRSLSKKGL